ncbi:MAG: hypothetical protein JWP46_1438, partial [Modestobacter sp.]|nr:hypothetical protein [Modestobacter sp.]
VRFVVRDVSPVPAAGAVVLAIGGRPGPRSFCRRYPAVQDR